MFVDEYRDKACQMEGVCRQLIEHRRQVQGGDLAPGWDAVSFWPVIVGTYSLLEQCLKLLVAVRTEGYLDDSDGSGKATAKGEGHNLARVFGRLTELDRGLLEERYAEYASFIQFDSQFPSLCRYLKALSNNGGQIAWRYFLLDMRPENMDGLPGPLSPDMLLEVTDGALDMSRLTNIWHWLPLTGS